MKVVVGMSAMEIGRLLRERRRSPSASRSATMADLSGIAVHTLSNIESGDGNPSLEILGRILDTLGLENGHCVRAGLPREPLDLP